MPYRGAASVNMFALPIALTAAGLGTWVVHPPARVFGLGWYLGFLCIPILLLLLNTGLGLPFAVAAWIVVGLAGIGSLRALMRFRRSRAWTELLVHPVVVLPLAYAVLTTTVHPAPYGVSRYDELSWWLLQPRQVLLTGSPASHALPFPYFARYTPGWPLLIAFPYALAGSPVVTDDLRWLPFLSAVGLVGVTYDLLRHAVHGFDPSAAWLVVGIIVCLTPGFALAAPDLLIEAPLVHAWSALLVLVLAADRGLAMSGVFVGRAAGILLTGGYLLKEPFLAAAPLAAAATWSVAKRLHASPRALRARAWLWAFGPLLAAAFLWRGATRWVKTAALPPYGSAPTSAEVLTNAARITAAAMAQVPLRETALVATGVLIAVLTVSRTALLAIGLSILCYLAGLFSLYVHGTFASELAGVLPAFTRYGSVVARVVAYGSTLLAATAVARLALRRPRVVPILLVPIGTGLAVALWFSLSEVHGPDSLGPTSMAIVQNARRVRDTITQRRIEPPRLMTLTRDLETGRFLREVLRYVSLETGGPPSFTTIGSPMVVRAPTPPRISFMRSMTPRQLKQRVRRADAVWILSADEWVVRILRRATRNPACVTDGALLIRMPGPGSSRLQCLPWHQVSGQAPT